MNQMIDDPPTVSIVSLHTMCTNYVFHILILLFYNNNNNNRI